MKKVIAWLKESNRIKHLAGGAFIGLLANDYSHSLFGSVIAATCLEYKDRAYGGKWDWIDYGLTVLGSLLGTLLRYIIKTVWIGVQ